MESYYVLICLCYASQPCSVAFVLFFYFWIDGHHFFPLVCVKHIIGLQNVKCESIYILYIPIDSIVCSVPNRWHEGACCYNCQWSWVNWLHCFCLQDVYRRCIRSVIAGVVQGLNATVFAYGSTGRYLKNFKSKSLFRVLLKSKHLIYDVILADVAHYLYPAKLQLNIITICF